MVWFSWTGLLLGLVSLYLMHDIVQRTFGRWFGWAFVFIVSGLSSFGVYLGRFVRFNSWDMLNDPKEIVVTVLGLAIDPSKTTGGLYHSIHSILFVRISHVIFIRAFVTGTVCARLQNPHKFLRVFESL